MTNICLIRHADTDLPDRVPGRLSGVHLSKSGLIQAALLAQRLKDVKIDGIYCSPLERTLETAAPLAETKGLVIIPDDHFIEIDFGEWTKKSFDELENEFGWKQFHFFRNGCVIPGGELMVEIQSRMIAGIQKICSRHPGETIAVFSHNDPIKSVIAYYLGVSLDLFLRIEISTTSVSVISIYENGAVVRGINLKTEVSSQ
jgi:broad specificity phosphatase PhoE